MDTSCNFHHSPFQVSLFFSKSLLAEMGSLTNAPVPGLPPKGVFQTFIVTEMENQTLWLQLTPASITLNKNYLLRAPASGTGHFPHCQAWKTACAQTEKKSLISINIYIAAMPRGPGWGKGLAVFGATGDEGALLWPAAHHSATSEVASCPFLHERLGISISHLPPGPAHPDTSAFLKSLWLLHLWI